MSRWQQRQIVLRSSFVCSATGKECFCTPGSFPLLCKIFAKNCFARRLPKKKLKQKTGRRFFKVLLKCITPLKWLRSLFAVLACHYPVITGFDLHFQATVHFPLTSDHHQLTSVSDYFFLWNFFGNAGTGSKYANTCVEPLPRKIFTARNQRLKAKNVFFVIKFIMSEAFPSTHVMESYWGDLRLLTTIVWVQNTFFVPTSAGCAPVRNCSTRDRHLH